ncbi:MAG: amidohydrolase family protein [Planctomycetota bacterium]
MTTTLQLQKMCSNMRESGNHPARLLLALWLLVVVAVVLNNSITAWAREQPSRSADSIAAATEQEQTESNVGEGSQDDLFEPMTIDRFDPTPTLRVNATELTHAAVPVIDAHTHFGFRLRGDDERLDEFVQVMNRNRIAICVSLDARLGTETDHMNFLHRKYKDRFIVFANIDFQGDGVEDQPSTWACNQPEFVHTVCEQLKVAKQNGIAGVKFFKQFGLGYRSASGELIRIDDRQFDPIWSTCGELGMPIIIHTGDPAAFFLPIDETNERYEELSRHPDWSFHGDEFPSREELLLARNRVIERHRETVFIGAHVAGNSEDLATVGQWLDSYPNLVVEFASRIGEMGRQPFTAREFLIRYQDRVLFGTDGPWPELRLSYYWRFLETNDEYFPYSEKSPPPQGLWHIYGVGLPQEVLEKIYYRNYLRMLPSVREQYDRAVIEMNAAQPGTSDRR